MQKIEPTTSIAFRLQVIKCLVLGMCSLVVDEMKTSLVRYGSTIKAPVAMMAQLR